MFGPPGAESDRDPHHSGEEGEIKVSQAPGGHAQIPSPCVNPASWLSTALPPRAFASCGDDMYRRKYVLQSQPVQTTSYYTRPQSFVGNGTSGAQT